MTDSEDVTFTVPLVPPSAIADVTATYATETSVTLTWTATGNAAQSGAAGRYVVKYALAPISSESEWQNASEVLGGSLPRPRVAGLAERYTVEGLAGSNQYYFAVRAISRAGLQSGLSNSPMAMTLPPAGRVLRVPSQYQTLSAALAVAKGGDSIQLDPGGYTFFPTQVTVPNIKIQGRGGPVKTVLTAYQSDYVLYVLADNVCITGFTMSGNVSIDAFGGALNFVGAHGGCVRQNRFTGNSTGLALKQSSEILVSNNDFTVKDFGIATQETQNSRFEFNNIFLPQGGQGIRLDVSPNQTLVANILTSTPPVPGQGIVVTGRPSAPAAGYFISHSTFASLSNAVFFQDATSITVRETSFSGSQYGIYNPAGGLFVHNSFIGNTHHASYNGGAFWFDSSSGEGNFWSDYSGFDDGSGSGKHSVAGDGIGDTSLPWPASGFDSFPFVRPGSWDTPPVLAPVGRRLVAKGVQMGIVLQGLDFEGRALTFGAQGVPLGASLDPATGRFLWSPTQAGVFTVRFSVSDGINSDSEDVSITVQDLVAPNSK